MTSVDAGLKSQEALCFAWILASMIKINLYGEIVLYLLNGFLVGVDCLFGGGKGYFVCSCSVTTKLGYICLLLLPCIPKYTVSNPSSWPSRSIRNR